MPKKLGGGPVGVPIQPSTGLQVLGGRTEGDVGWVRFDAHLVQGGRAGVIAENSRFYRVGGRWLYHSADPR